MNSTSKLNLKAFQMVTVHTVVPATQTMCGDLNEMSSVDLNM